MDPAAALTAWNRAGTLSSADDGLINRTWIVHEVDTGRPDAVLQWVNPIFPVEVEQDIATVTEWLASQDLTTPRLRARPTGELWLLDDDSGHWRLMDYVPGRTLHHLATPAQAAGAGRLVGRFHAAMQRWPGRFVKPTRRIHDTPARMSELQSALQGCDGHPLAERTRVLGARILGDWSTWEGPLVLPERPCHGDLKVSNIRFAAAGDDAVCLIDLDTLGPQRLADELGDAWRSWCNPAGEDDLSAVRFDLALFEASARAWLAVAPPLQQAERDSLVPGIERICLELAARFCADAVADPTYFREDRQRFPIRGTHDLHRADAQLRLARRARAARSACERIVYAA